MTATFHPDLDSVGVRDKWAAASVAGLVAEVRRRGFTIVVGDDGPVIRAAVRAGHLPGDLVAALRDRRAEVLAHLAGEGRDGTLPCDVCGRTWFCSEAEVRSCVVSPAWCDRPTRADRRWGLPASAIEATPCPWKS